MRSAKIEHIKQLQHRIKYGPSNHAYCIVIIQNIQKSTNSAKNALLKSIEEPPEKTIFFLSSENKYNVSATIRSRAQQFFIPNQNEPSQSDYQAMINKMNVDLGTGELSLFQILIHTLSPRLNLIHG